jgi:hypothetical protein
MSNHPYKFDPSSKKFICPNCNKRKFVKYIFKDTNDYLPDIFGKCDRLSCEELSENNPYKSGFLKEQKVSKNRLSVLRPTQEIKPAKKEYIPRSVLGKSTRSYQSSGFYKNLNTNVKHIFPSAKLDAVFETYHLGVVKQNYLNGALTIPFINFNQKICAIQVKEFDHKNHTLKTNYVHSLLEWNFKKQKRVPPDWLKSYSAMEKKVSCLFGEHLLKDFKNNPVALVEAPKTAIYGALYFGLPETPSDLIWLAVYNLSSLKFEKCKILEGRDVILFPDLSKESKAFDLWSNRAKDFEKRLPDTTFKVYDYLEHVSTEEEKNDGHDLADYLIQKDWKEFNSDLYDPELEAKEWDLFVTSLKEESDPSYISQKEIMDLKQYFKRKDLSENTMILNSGEKILDLKKMIESHFLIIECKNSPTIIPYVERLQKLRDKLTERLTF